MEPELGLARALLNARVRRSLDDAVVGNPCQEVDGDFVTNGYRPPLVPETLPTLYETEALLALEQGVELPDYAAPWEVIR